MKARDFAVARRPALAKIVKYPIQQAYLGTRERAVVVLEGWDTAGKGGIVRRLGWASDPRSFKALPDCGPIIARTRPTLFATFLGKAP
jgi:polyphosphate kinase 2 (PPK2 family)